MMVQTLNGAWWLWLVPLFLLSLAVMIPASRSELGLTGRRKREEQPAHSPLPETGIQPKAADSVPKTTAEDEWIEVVLMAAAAYCTAENNRGGNKMRNLKITVNGKTYDVTVEEEGKTNDYAPRFTPARPAPAARPAAAVPAQAAAPAKSVAPAQAAAVPGAPAAAGAGVKVEAPMSGRVVEIVAPVGTAVKPGDAILVMEAMKLQSEICAETAGTVQQILVSPKQDITTGQVVAVLG